MIDRLYEKIGGRDTVNALVQVFYDKVRADPRLGRFFQSTDMENLKARQAMFLTMLLGGTRSFSGMDLNQAHAKPRAEGMADDDFDALLRVFDAALREVRVEHAYIHEVLSLLESTRDRVMGRG